jgi:filamentous hemagglutinin family protein
MAGPAVCKNLVRDAPINPHGIHGTAGVLVRRDHASTGWKRSAIAFACSVIWSAHPLAAPSGATVTAGSGSITQNGSTTTVTQNTGKLAINWNSFGIRSGETVNFVQPGSGSIVLNRVTGGGASAILGTLNANGTVFILNPNGVLFGAGAQVNVGGLVASTLGMSDTDFLAGRYGLSGNSAASVVNQGALSVPAGGKVALIATSVNNAGTINAPQGNVLLAGASGVTLTLVDGSPLSYTISQGAANALVSNGGMILADGGHVVLTAQGLDALSQAVVNSTGVVRAQTVAGHQGTIELLGDPNNGTTQVSGTLDASAPAAGGIGGTVEVLGAKVGLFDSARVDVTGPAGGGTALIGGNSRGLGPQPDASAAWVAPGATIDASSAQTGNGGKIVVWGTDSANVYGTLLATGGAQNGNGGSIETSGHVLDTNGISVDVAAGTSGGTGGLWLLDPYNVTISTGTQTGGSFSTNVWAPSASGSLVNISNIQAILNSGSNVTITTTGAGTQEGNIAINGSIAKTAGGDATLTLSADGRITTNASAGGHRTISSASGALNVAMNANATTSASGTSGISLSYLDISANGGNITATAAGAQSGTAPALQLQNSTWATSGSGTISLTGTLPSSGNSQGVYLKSTTLTTTSGAISIAGTSGGIATVTGTNSNGASLFSTNDIGVALAGNNTLRSTGGGTIALTGIATGATGTWAGGGVKVSALDTLVTSGALTISGTATNPISTVYRNQLSAVDIAGSNSSAATLTGDTVTITGSNQVVGGVPSTSNANAAVKLEGNVNITATGGAIAIFGSNTGGDGVWGSSTGAVTMSAPSSSAVNITAQSLASVSGYSGFYIGSGTLTFLTAVPVNVTSSSASSARNAFWNKGGLVVPGNLSITTTGGAIADDTSFGGYFHVSGTTTINSSGAGDTISLTNSNNAFEGTLSLTGGDTTLANSTTLTLGPSAISGTLSLSAPGITQTGALTVDGSTNVNAGAHAISLDNALNLLYGPVAMTASNSTLVDGTALTVAASTITGDLNLTAAGIGQSGALNVAGIATLNGGNGAITLTDQANDLHSLSVAGATGADITSASGLTVTGILSTGSVRLTTMNGDLNTQGNWSVSNGDLTLSAGASNARGTSTGGDLKNAATFTLDAGKTIMVYTGSMSSTALGGSLAQRAISGSGDFRYDRQNGDAPGATGVGDGTTYVMYRERPVVTVTPTDAVNTKIYDGSAGGGPQLAYNISGQVNGDSAAQVFAGSLARASGQDVGSYAISSGTLADQLGYEFVLAPGHTFRITPAPLVIAVNGASRGVGQNNPQFGVTYRGLVGGDTAQSADLQGALSFFTSAGLTSPAGCYAVTATGLSSRNYSITYVDGTLTVLPVSLSTVMLGSAADDASYLGAVADARAKARLADARNAPIPAQRTRQGWRTATAVFQLTDIARPTSPAERTDSPK